MKEKLPVRILNLERAAERRAYMQELLSEYDFLDVRFVKGVDGRQMSEAEIDERFDREKSLRKYGRAINKGEIGCALSHRLCAEQIVAEGLDYALVLEDDIAIMRDFNELKDIDIDSIMRTERPTVLFLSGDFWWWSRNGRIANVYDAVGAYAYILNQAAAKRIVNSGKPYLLGDDWTAQKRLGLEYKAVMPYMVDANLDMDHLGTCVDQDEWGINRRQMSVGNIWRSYANAMAKRLFKLAGHFEKKVRVIDGKVVEG